MHLVSEDGKNEQHTIAFLAILRHYDSYELQRKDHSIFSSWWSHETPGLGSDPKKVQIDLLL